MKLRDGDYKSLDELCTSLDIDKDLIEKRLNEAGFEYQPAPVNQFK